MRKSRQETAQTRRRIIANAARRMRARGIAATGLADIMQASGLTHGGFYKHFTSKSELVREMTAWSIIQTTSRLQSVKGDHTHRAGVVDAVNEYLSEQHRDNPGGGCSFTSIGAELARADRKTRSQATAGFEQFVEVLMSRVEAKDERRARSVAIAAASTMIGAMTMARMVNDRKLSNLILKSARDAVIRSLGSISVEE